MILLISVNSDANKRNVNKSTQIYTKEYFYNQQSKMIDQVEVTLTSTSSCQGQSIIIKMLRETVSHKWHYDEAY